MKTTIVLLFIFCAAAAFGQVGGSAISSQPNEFHMSGNPEHASPHALGEEHSLVGGMGGTYTVMSGERPLWEFGPVKEEVPLGDVARAYREEKKAVRKAEITFEKQGS